MKSFVLIFNGGSEERDKLKKVLDEIPEVCSWRYDMVSCIYILSNHSAKTLYDGIKSKYPDIGRHLITEFGSDYWGELTELSWKFLENREPYPKSNK